MSTAEGVPLGRIYADNNNPLSDDVLSSIESTWAPASKQFPLLNMGKEIKTVTAVYDHGKFAAPNYGADPDSLALYVVNADGSKFGIRIAIFATLLENVFFAVIVLTFSI